MWLPEKPSDRTVNSESDKCPYDTTLGPRHNTEMALISQIEIAKPGQSTIMFFQHLALQQLLTHRHQGAR